MALFFKGRRPMKFNNNFCIVNNNCLNLAMTNVYKRKGMNRRVFGCDELLKTINTTENDF